MNKVTLIIIFLINSVYAQKAFNGVVKHNNLPIKNASIYINGSFSKTNTNHKGEFLIIAPKGAKELIVNHNNYTIKSINLSDQKSDKLLKINLLNKPHNSAGLSKVKSKYLKYDYAKFKNNFLGFLHKNIIINNPEDISINYNEKRNELSAISNKTIQITNNILGYNIFYDLLNFNLTNGILKIKGYYYFKKINKKNRTADWVGNRKKVYRFSMNHFLKALNHNKTNSYYKVSEIKLLENREKIKKHVCSEPLPYIEKEIRKIDKIDEIVKEKNGEKLLSFMNFLKISPLKKTTTLQLKNNRRTEYPDLLLYLTKKNKSLVLGKKNYTESEIINLNNEYNQIYCLFPIEYSSF